MKVFAKCFTLVAMAQAACSGSNNNVQFTNQTFTLQGIVADAVTGQRIGGDLKLFLIQGADVRGPSRLVSSTSDPLAGEYAFAGIPAASNCNNSAFKVVAVKTGYQRFESEIRFCFTKTSLSTNEILDAVLTRIGNIYLYPVGVASPDYRFTVYYNGSPVSAAVVQLDPMTDSNNGTFLQSTNTSTLANTGGYVAALSAQTDTTGHVTFAGTTLAMGGVYSVQVLPLSVKNSSGSITQLGVFTAQQQLVPGQSATDVLLTVSSVQVALYATSASNQAVGQLTPTGQLVVTFSAPVALTNPTKFGATMSGGGAAVLAAQPVNATLSADGLKLTLSPNYTTPPAATDKNVSINYANATAALVPKDSPAFSYTLFGAGAGSIQFLDNSALQQSVQISGP